MTTVRSSIPHTPVTPERPLIYGAFIAAQAEFEQLKKETNNPFFRSKYADLASVIESVKGALKKHKIGMRQIITETDSVGITSETVNKDGSITTEQVGFVAVETILFCEDGSELRSGPLRLPSLKNDAQGLGSAITYARRYSLMAALGIAGEDDDGNAASTSGKITKKRYATKDLQTALTGASTVDALRAIWGSLEESQKTTELYELVTKRKEELNG